MTQPNLTPTPTPENNFAGHNMIPHVPGFDAANIRPRLTESDMRFDLTPNAIPSQDLKSRPQGDQRRTIGVETMFPTIKLDPALPADLTPVTNKFALLWESDEAGLLITRVGVHISLVGRDIDKWWPCVDSKGKEVVGLLPENAIGMYDKVVFPYLLEVFAGVLKEYGVRKAELELARTLA